MFLLKDLSNGRTPEVMKFLPGQNQNHFCFVEKILYDSADISISLCTFHF